jgi:2-polyprenyl-3-methyl-5-hydroxy-6-metoxy-1,4-benzoquinol methylase
MSGNAHAQDTEAEDRAYFHAQLQSNIEFWRRFGRQPDFEGKAVLDLGCGHGALSIDAARNGATVLGIDLDADRIEFAKGKDLVKINSAMGHSNIATTERYLHARPAADQAEVFTAAFNPSPARDLVTTGSND